MTAVAQVEPKKGTRRRLVVMLALLAAMVSGSALFYLGLSTTVLGGWMGMKPPLWLREARYQEVISDIGQGRLVSPTTGVFTVVDYADFALQLPPSHQGLTPQAIVFAEERSDGRWFVIFPTWHGFHDDMMGYLYCSEPLTPGDFELNNGWGIEAVFICGQSLKVTHIEGPWYSIDKGLD